MAEEAYQGLAGEMVQAMEPNTESDPAGLLVMLLSVLGNVIGRGAAFTVEEDRHYCKIWPVLVGETAKGRKGTALNRIRRLMERVDPDWYESCIATGLSSGEGVMERLRDPVVEEDEDGSLQIVDTGATDKRLLIEVHGLLLPARATSLLRAAPPLAYVDHRRGRALAGR
jgi:hypothetical protein